MFGLFLVIHVLFVGQNSVEICTILSHTKQIKHMFALFQPMAMPLS